MGPNRRGGKAGRSVPATSERLQLNGRTRGAGRPTGLFQILPGGRAKWGVNFPTWWVMNFGWHLLSGALDGGHMAKPIRLEYFTAYKGIPGVMLGPSLEHMYANGEGVDWEHCPSMKLGRTVRFPKLTPKQLMEIHPVVFFEPAIFFYKIPSCRVVECPGCGGRATSKGPNYGLHKRVFDIDRSLITFSREWLCNASETNELTGKPGCGYAFNLTNPGYIGKLPPAARSAYDNVVLRDKNSVTRDTMDLISRIGAGTSMLKVERFLKDATITRYLRLRLWLTEIQITNAMCAGHDGNSLSDVHKYFEAMDELVVDKSCISTKNGVDALMRFAEPLPNDPLREDFGVGHRSPQHSMEFLADAYTTWQVRDLAAKGDEIPARLHNALLDLAGLKPPGKPLFELPVAAYVDVDVHHPDGRCGAVAQTLTASTVAEMENDLAWIRGETIDFAFYSLYNEMEDEWGQHRAGGQQLLHDVLLVSTNAVVNLMCHYDTREFPEYQVATDNTRKFVRQRWFSAEILAAFGYRRRARTAAVDPATGQPMIDAHRVILPVNASSQPGGFCQSTRRNHWYTVVVDNVEGSITILDTLRRMYVKHHEWMMSILPVFLNDIRADADLPARRWTTVVPQNYPTQGNYCDCGAHVLQMAECYARGLVLLPAMQAPRHAGPEQQLPKLASHRQLVDFVNREGAQAARRAVRRRIVEQFRRSLRNKDPTALQAMLVLSERAKAQHGNDAVRAREVLVNVAGDDVLRAQPLADILAAAKAQDRQQRRAELRHRSTLPHNAIAGAITRLLHHWYSAFDMEQMSEFADEGYDGKFLSYGAIMGRYLEEFLRLEPFMNCVLDSVCAESYVLRGDTTFKVAKGIHLGGGRVCDGMYLVLNEIGQVVAYNFVTSESDAAMQPILQSLATRLKYFRALEGKEGDGIKAFYDDLCCLRDTPILAAFPDLKLVRVDLWHAMNRVLRKTKSSHPLFKTFSGMFALCFLEYDQGDLEKYKSYIDAEAQRTTVSRRAKLPQPGTPLSKLPYYKHCRRHCRARVRPPEEIERCLESLVAEMEERAAGGEPIIQSDSGDGVKHNREAIDNLLEHVRRGCLQDWSGRLEDMYTVDPGKHRCGLPQYLALRGSGYNEALHHRLNQVMPSNHNSMLFTHAKMLTSITMWNKEKADKHTEGAVLPTTDLTTVHDINHLEARIYGQAPYAHVVRADPEAPHGSHGFGEHFKVFGTRGEGLTTPEHMAMINMQDKLDNVPADSARYTAMSASSSHVCDEELSLDTAGIGSLDADFQAVNSKYHAKKKEVADALAAQEGPKGARTLVGHSLKRKRPAQDEDDQGGGIVTRGAAKKTKGEKKRGGTRYKSGKGSSRAVRRTPGVVRRAGAYREEKMGEGVPAAMKGQIGLRPKDPSKERNNMQACLHTSNPGLVIDEMKACVGLGASTIRHGESRTVPARIIAAGGPGKNRVRKVAEFQAYLRGKIDALSERQRDVLARAPGGLPAQAQGDAGVVAAQAEPVEQKPPVE
ncbi:unnamed protein product [Pedinophyceae sp. YPF-701]|nr:unnamed protein product [Pedinophyceae sp. YPF-701]